VCALGRVGRAAPTLPRAYELTSCVVSAHARENTCKKTCIGVSKEQNTSGHCVSHRFEEVNIT